MNLPRYAYLGAGAKHQVLKQWLAQTASASAYVDATAGSCNQPYAICKAHCIPTTTNDGNYYSFCIGTALLLRQRPTQRRALIDIIEDAQRETSPTGQWPVEFNRSHLTPFLTWTIKHSQRLRNEDRCFLLANVGSVILMNLTYRARTFDIKRIETIRPAVIAERLIKAIDKRNEFVAYHPQNKCYNFHVWDAALQMPLKGATVNIDPAWPYKAKADNPYHLYRVVGAFLQGKREQSCFPFWQNPNNASMVASEFAAWLTRFFERGAAEVFVWNQSTNIPSKDMLINVLRTHMQCEAVMAVYQSTVNDDKQTFEDYVLRCTPLHES